ncbi:28 kDa heat- and acid-stable phosphoprotein isoform X1 [Hydra vulgaris]|nr:28 kDa heat- and acid-stable phosphoprotein [Hydra vulgaris]
MPRGRGKNYKGRTRHFTSAEEIDRQMNDDEWRKKQDEARNRNKEENKKESSEEEESESESESESEDEDEKKKNLIDIENPNRVQNKMKKAGEITSDAPKPELSRREREAIEKEQARLRYEKLHAEGKTDEARADLARLAIVRKQREEAAKKKDLEKLAKEKELKDAEEARKKAMEAQLNPSKPGGRRKKL